MKQIVVISGKGGTGKTSVTAALAAIGPAKVMADCDVDASDLHLVLDPRVRERREFVSGCIARIDPGACIGCGECRETCRFGAISENLEVRSAQCEGCGACAYVCAAGAVRMAPRSCGEWFVSDTRFGPMVHAALGIGEENSGKLVTTVRKAAKDAAEAAGLEYVLADGSPGIGCPVIASLADVDLAVVVVEPTVSALHDLQRVHALLRHFNVPALAVINKADINPALTGAIRAFCDRNSIPVGGELGYDPAFTQAQLAGLTVVEFEPSFRAAFESVWSRIEDALAAETV